MSGHTVPSTTIEEQAKAAGKTDVVIGIPSRNNEKTIGHVVKVCEEGISKFFPNLHAVIVNSDGNSTDRTREVVRETGRLKKIVGTYSGIPGKGSALRAVFKCVHDLDAKAGIVVDSDLRSITPGWMKLLLEPIIHGGYGYVTPYYRRHKYDGTITNNITYPLTRALYGMNVRQPIGGDFCFSRGLAEAYLRKDVWETDVAKFGIDIWMTTTAIAEGFKIAQAGLGAKIHDAKDPGASLGPMFREVVGTLFSTMTTYEGFWKGVSNVKDAPVVAENALIINDEPEPISVNEETLINKFRAGAESYHGVWDKVIRSKHNRDAIHALLKVEPSSRDGFNFSPELWVPIVYDYATAYCFRTFDTNTIIESFVPIYYGRVEGFVQKSRDMSTDEAEVLVQKQAELFLKEKEYLMRAWSEEKKKKSAETK